MTDKPTRYELIDKDGDHVATCESASRCMQIAAHLFPDLEQDPNRTGRGWHVQVVESANG